MRGSGPGGAIAIIGMACRLPGANTPEAAWDLIVSGGHAISEAPPERWATRQKIAAETNAKVQSYPKWGGYLAGIENFDPKFFGISMREARLMDPQQRLLMQTSWQAIESADLDPSRLKGSRTGVFVGISTSDYLQRQLLDAELLRVDAYSGLGTAQSIAANRLSYFYDFNGPSMAVDTACSSSLVALHLARQSLQAGECDYAIVGGVNVIVSPLSTISFSKARMLAPDGRCKSFDKSADGYVRSEGCVTLVLTGAELAAEQSHRPRALIRGSAVNQDGTTLSITTPRGEAQERVVTDALANAGLSPADIDFIEAHGTGTRIGDAIELQALHNVFDAAGTRECPVLVGSAKPHFGHLEAASGLVGLLKAAKSLEHGMVPPMPIQEPVETAGGSSLALATRLASLSARERPLRGGVSCFGFGGTNAHVILEQPAQAPAVSAMENPARPARLMVLPVSSHSPATFSATAADYEALIKADEALDLEALGAAAAKLRSGHAYRRALVFSSRDELIGKLQAAKAEDLSRDDRLKPGKLAFCFAGQGSQFAGMCQSLVEADESFRDTMLVCNEVTEKYGQWSLLDVLAEGAAEVARIDDTKYAQPALFAIGLGLARAWMAHGVMPDYVIGHSLGEIIGACVAGVMDEITAMRLVLVRGQLMGAAPGRGAMLSLTADTARLTAFLETALAESISGSSGLEVSGRNAPGNVTLSGSENAIDAMLSRAASEGIKAQKLPVSHAFHSHMMDAVLADFEREISDFIFEAPRIPLVSNITGELVGREMIEPEYWVRHIRTAVNFERSVQTLVEKGVGTIVEIGPRPILSPWLREMSPAGNGFSIIPALQRNRDDELGLLNGLATAYARGWSVDWSVRSEGRHLPRVPLPPYRFAEEKVWFETYRAEPGTPLIANSETAETPTTGGDSTLVSRRDLAGETVKVLEQHRVNGRAIVPGALYLELLTSAARTLAGQLPVALQNCKIPNMLSLAEGLEHRLVVTGQALGEKRWALNLTAIHQQDGSEKLLAHAIASTGDFEAPARDLGALAADLDQSMPGPDLYASLEDNGLLYGPAFQGVTDVQFASGEALALVVAPRPGVLQHQTLDPCQLDAGLHAIAPALTASEGETAGGLWVPIGCRKVIVHGSIPAMARVHVTFSDGPHFPDQKALDIAFCDETGKVEVELRGLEIRRIENRQGAPETGPLFHLTPFPLPDFGGRPAESPGWKAGWQLVDLAGNDNLLSEITKVLDAPVTTTDPSNMQGGSGTLAVIVDESAGADASHQLVARFVAIARELARGTDRGVSRLVAIFRTSEAPTPTGEAIRAAMRVLRNEAPMLKPVSVSIPAGAPETALETALASASLRPEEPDQIWTEGRMHALRLQPATAKSNSWTPAPRQGAEKVLVPGGKGGIANLALNASDGAEPGEHEVAIAPLAAGLNFRDVLKSLKLYPNRPGMPLWLGDECVGTVTATGGKVTKVKPGDYVMAIAPRAFATSVLAPETAVVKLPATIAPTDAATIPIAFSTAWYGLVELARIRKGETVLIHAAAGGVGLAAVQIALAQGAKVIATAGSNAKRDFLLGLGVAAVGNSRDLSFVETVKSATGGAGVDIVLNSLAGEAIQASLELLKPFGRFVEIGKRDIVEGSELSLRPFHKSVSFHALDMELLFARFPEESRRVLEAITAELAKGRLRPLPHETFPLERAAEGFQYMAQARNIGKVVFTIDRAALVGGAEPQPRSGEIDAALVTGAFGGIGIELVQQLAEAGIKGFVLLGRSEPRKAIAKILDRLRARGITIVTARADVADEKAIAEAMFATAPKAGLAVRHIVHAAGVLADKLVADVDEEAVAKAWAPKVAGADILDRLSRKLEIETFVCLSSISTVLGSPGQVAYAAANAGMDAICARRYADGLPAAAISFGPWETGLAAANDDTRSRFDRLGLRSFSVADGLRVFHKALSAGGPLTVAARFAPQFTGEAAPAIANLAVCRHLYGKSGGGGGARKTGGSAIVRSIFTAEEPARPAMLARFLADKLAGVMSQSADEIPTDKPLETLGFDSLAGLEFGMMVEEELGTQFPMDAISETTTLDDLAALLLGALSAEGMDSEADEIDNALSHQDQVLDDPASPARLLRPAASEPFEPVPGSTADYVGYVRPDISQFLPVLKLDADYEEAHGTKLVGIVDGERREVTDFAGGYGACLFGHNHPRLVAAAMETLRSGRPVQAQGAARGLTGRLARELSETLGAEVGGKYHVAISNSGAEAVEGAIKHAALEYHARFKSYGIDLADPLVEGETVPVFLAIEGSYHGKTLGALSLGHFRYWKRPSHGLRVRTVPRNDIAALKRIIAQERVRCAGTPASLIAGAFVEPVQGEGGVHPLEKDFLQALRDAADEHGFPLVFDEIQSGFYRCGAFAASAELGVAADYYTFGKSLGGGIAKISALLVRSERYQQGFGVLQTSTFAEDDFSAQIALTALDLAKSSGIGTTVMSAGAHLRHKLDTLRQRYPDVIASIRGRGLMLGLEIADLSHCGTGLIAYASRKQMLAQLVCSHLLVRHDLRTATTLSAPGTIRLQPPAEISQAEIDTLIGALETICTALRNGDGAYLASHLGARDAWLGESRDWRGETTPSTPPVATEAMRRVAFLGHFADDEAICRWDLSLSRLTADAREALIARLAPVVPPTLIRIERVRSATGEEVEVQFLSLFATSLTIETAMRTGRAQWVVDQVQQAVDMAADAGCTMAGLGGFLSIVSHNGTRLSSPRIGLTTGNALTVAAGIEALKRAVAQHLPGENIRIGIVGAAGNIGRTYVRALAREFDCFTLVGRGGSTERLDALAAALRDASAHAGRQPPAITVADTLDALRACNVVISATNTSMPIIEASHLGDGPTVLLDISVPPDVAPDVRTKRPNAHLVPGGIVGLPEDNSVDLGAFGLMGNHMFACMAETAVLGLEDHRDNYAVGEIRLAQVEEISALAAAHGFILGASK